MSVEYDERLLASAPAATRKERQEGYNIDLLDNGRGAPTSGSSTPPVLAPNEDYAENGLPAKEVTPRYASATTPWYKTKKGLIILFVAAIVIIAAVVGGAVGGTVGKHKNNGSSSDASGGGTASGGDGGVSAGDGPAGAAGAEPANNHSASSPSSSTTPPASATGANPGSIGP
ncbi:hypothetical protein EUX98_g3719 [Antrodiella citrinella]|uniref:Uncharacterized protein n=1 Tax=Antrodiella citrinella TaxID=2447956 RepID=A0A4S4N3Z7_9APHY|nr:hypothetical protein EUX98_g3719 [Antrodiella citrinella]